MFLRNVGVSLNYTELRSRRRYLWTDFSVLGSVKTGFAVHRATFLIGVRDKSSGSWSWSHSSMWCPRFIMRGGTPPLFHMASWCGGYLTTVTSSRKAAMLSVPVRHQRAGQYVQKTLCCKAWHNRMHTIKTETLCISGSRALCWALVAFQFLNLIHSR
jgi:hypothetical protein